jgi:hypothetical protein
VAPCLCHRERGLALRIELRSSHEVRREMAAEGSSSTGGRGAPPHGLRRQGRIIVVRESRLALVAVGREPRRRWAERAAGGDWTRRLERKGRVATGA